MPEPTIREQVASILLKSVTDELLGQQFRSGAQFVNDAPFKVRNAVLAALSPLLERVQKERDEVAILAACYRPTDLEQETFESELRRRVEGLTNDQVWNIASRQAWRTSFNVMLLTALLAPPATPETERE